MSCSYLQYSIVLTLTDTTDLHISELHFDLSVTTFFIIFHQNKRETKSADKSVTAHAYKTDP